MKSTLYVLIVGAVLLLAGAITFFVVEPKTPPASAVTNYSQPKGFWRDIRVNEGEGEITTPAFFCQNTGNYQGHIVDSKQGWWIVYDGPNKKASYASEEFAKKAVEGDAVCK